MAAFKWKSQEDTDREQEAVAKREKKKMDFKNKSFTTLSSKEKDTLLELLAIQAGLIEEGE